MKIQADIEVLISLQADKGFLRQVTAENEDGTHTLTLAHIRTPAQNVDYSY